MINAKLLFTKSLVICLKDETGKEVFHEIKVQCEPGISTEGGKKWARVLKDVVELIPEGKRIKTPAVLKATAGLRAKSAEEATSILKECRETMTGMGLFVRNAADATEIMDGTLEAVYAWISVNAFKNFLGKTPKETVGIMDLGGGSTQIVTVVDKEELAGLNPDDVVQQTFGAVTYDLYAVSFMHYGLQSFRKRMLFGDPEDYSTDSPMSNRCILKGTKDKEFGDWDGAKKVISHPEEVLMEECDKEVQKYIGEPSAPTGEKSPSCSAEKTYARLKCSSLPDLKSKPFIAMSYFYDLGKSYKLQLSNAKLDSLKKTAEEVCKLEYTGLVEEYQHNPDDIKDEHIPFACIDMLYLYNLLTHGYGMNTDKVVNIEKEINGFEATWAYGCMLKEMGLFKKEVEKTGEGGTVDDAGAASKAAAGESSEAEKEETGSATNEEAKGTDDSSAGMASEEITSKK